MDREYLNVHDRDACLVWIPQKETFTEEQLLLETDEKRYLKLDDITGLPIGHVPRGLATAFRDILDIDGKIYAIAKSKAVQSFPPWPPVFENGGGAIIPCDYVVYHNDRVLVMNMITNAVHNMPEKEVMRIE